MLSDDFPTNSPSEIIAELARIRRKIGANAREIRRLGQAYSKAITHDQVLGEEHPQPVSNPSRFYLTFDLQ